jgi:hypothetical protein
VREALRYVSTQDSRAEIADLKKIYQAATDPTIEIPITTSLPPYGISHLITVVPEPSSVILAMFGVAGLFACGCRRKPPLPV